MELSNLQSLSKSTIYRYKKANKEKELLQFQQFKAQNKILTEKISLQQIKVLKNIYTHGIAGRDNHNHLILFDKIGSLKINEITKIIDEDSFVNYTAMRLIQISENILSQKQTIIWVFDLSGKIMQLASKKALIVVNKIIQIAVEYFPEIIHKLVFVNTPMLFDTVWNQIANNISQSTQQKAVFLGNDQSQLLEFVDKQLIPQFLGGNLPDQQLNNEYHKESYNYQIEFNKQNHYLNKQNSPNQSKKTKGQQQEGQQQNFDFSQLKAALNGMSFGKSLNLGIPSVTQTPLNTQADDR